MASKEKRGLGTGLDALFGADSYDEGGSELLRVPIGRIEPRADQPRQVFDEQALEALAESIDRYGLIQPVTVRALGDGYYQIIAGERRWRAARMAGLEELPVRVIEADDRRAAELALVENLQREDLNPIEEAEGYRTLMEQYGLTQEEAARSVGRSRPAVANSLRLLNLSAPVLAMVESGALSAGHARALLPIADAAAQLSAAEEVVRKSFSVRQTERLAARRAKPEAPAADAAPEVDYADEVSRRLEAALGRRVRLLDKRSPGQIVLEYYDADDREALIADLEKLGRCKADGNKER